MMADPGFTVLFAGGGTGGHLFPGLAVAERLREMSRAAGVHFACSDRPLDGRILSDAGEGFTPLSVRPLPTRPGRVPGFLLHYRRSCREAVRLMRDERVGVVVSMGGFVSGPVVAAARKRGVPTMLVNLDAVPGKANRWLARRCDRIFSVYETPLLPTDRTEPAGMPLRTECIGSDDAAANRRALGLDETKPVLLVTGASQGAESINRTMMELARRARFREAMRGWQVLHLAGADQTDAVEGAYREAGMAAKVVAFSKRMGRVWGAAELAISRAGAGSVAEVAANGVPAVFLPYPFHKDQHQRLNAAPLIDAGGAALFDDAADGSVNADRLLDPLAALLSDRDRRDRMRAALRGLNRGDGAERLAVEALRLCGQGAEVSVFGGDSSSYSG